MLKTPAQKAELGDGAGTGKKFMQHVMQGQKDDFEMQNKSFLTYGDNDINKRF